MKISEVSVKDVMDFIRLDAELESEEVNELTNIIMPAVLADMVSYTGLTSEELDTHDDLTIVFLVKCQDMFDNRATDDKEIKKNRIVTSLLARYRRNYV